MSKNCPIHDSYQSMASEIMDIKFGTQKCTCKDKNESEKHDWDCSVASMHFDDDM